MGNREDSLEMRWSFLKRESNLLPQGAIAGCPLYFVLPEKSNAPSLPLVLLPDLPHLILQGQRFLPDLLKSIEAKLPDFVARDAEDFAEDCIALPWYMMLVLHDFAVLQQQDVINLLLCKLFHQINQRLKWILSKFLGNKTINRQIKSKHWDWLIGSRYWGSRIDACYWGSTIDALLLRLGIEALLLRLNDRHLAIGSSYAT